MIDLVLHTIKERLAGIRLRIEFLEMGIVCVGDL